MTWAALLLNVLTPAGAAMLIPIPMGVAQALAQGSLLVAIVFALLANPRLVIRPNLLLVLFTMLGVEAAVMSLHSPFPAGSIYRAARLVGFILCLWLLTPWFGRADLVLLRVHRLWLWVIVVSVAVGAVLAPGKAFGEQSRLGGTLWPIPPTQVAHYCAVLIGTTVIVWLCRIITGRHALLVVVVTTPVLLGTHTRTALLGLAIGLALAGASLYLGHARVRRASASTLAFAIVVATLFGSQITEWLSRGQSTEDAAQLTGRTKVWTSVSESTRPFINEVFGAGLSNKSFDGLPVDSAWVATYLDLGWLGVVIQASVLLVLLYMVAIHVRGPRRAVALFLVVYCIVASITETGLGDASPYVLDLVVAASLLVGAPRPPRASGARSTALTGVAAGEQQP